MPPMVVPSHMALFLMSMPLLVHAAMCIIHKLADSPGELAEESVRPRTQESTSRPTAISVTDVKISLCHAGHLKLSERRVLSYAPTGEGDNVMEVSKRSSSQERLVLVLKMAESVQALHSYDIIHLNISPDAFRVEGGYLILLDAKLYAAAQDDREENRIRMGCSHLYKARAELVQDPLTPVEAMDVFSFAKTVTAMYVGAHPTLIFSTSVPSPVRPSAMPEALWEILQPCLKEDLVNIPSIDEVLLKLKAIM